MRVVLIATGFSTELSLSGHDRPTPLFRVVDKPIIIQVIEFLTRQGITAFDIVLSHLPQLVEEVVGDGKRWGVKITYHLVRDPDQPFVSLRQASKKWTEPLCLVGQGDRLPHFSVQELICTAQDQATLLFYSQKQWSGWGLIPTSAFSNTTTSCTQADFLERIRPCCRIVYVGSFLSTRSFYDLQKTHQRLLSHAQAGDYLPTTAKLVEPGLWISRASSVHPSVQIVGPVFIGEHCQIRERAILGPNVTIESGCIVDSGAVVQDSIICRNSYVGEALEVKNSIVEGKRLTNLSWDTQVHVPDSFLLCDVQPPPLLKRAVYLSSRILAGLLLILLSPIIIPMLLMRTLERLEAVHLPAPRDHHHWKTFIWFRFLRKEKNVANWMLILDSLPALYNVFRGDAHLVGLAPRTVQQLNKLPCDWKHVLLSSKVGIITLAAVEYGSSPSPDELYVSESYYTAHKGVWYDIKLAFRWLKNLFSKSR